MKKITILLLFVLVSVWGFAQDPSPIPSIMVKKLIAPNNPTFYYDQADSSVWIYKGLYGWTKLADSARLQKDYVPYENAWRHVNLDTMSIRTGYVDLVAKNNPIHTPYRLFSDTTNHTLAFYNDEEHVTMQIGQEMWSRIYNNGSIALNGKVVRINGSFSKVATITLASNVIHTSAEGVLGVATHDIETNTYGFITTFGEVHDLNTSMCSEGALLYLGTNGTFTHIRPVSPNFVIEIGTCIYSHATEGKILVNIKGSPHDIIQNAFNGSFMEGMKFSVTSDGTTITGSLQLIGGGDLTAIFSDGFTTIDCTPAKTITLTQGSATVPQTNWVYLLKSTKDIAVSTSGWPTDEHIKISEVACRTAAQTLADGALRNQNWNDHLSGTNGMGHLQHVNERVRRIPSDWFSGTELTVNLVSASTPDDIYFNVTGGKVYQMHLQDFPVQSMPTADIHIVNHFTTPFITVNNINTQLIDALNVTLVNRSFSFVVWGVQNESGENSHLMLNLPIGSYTSSPLAIADASNYSVYTIPSQFRGVGFLIARITMSHSSAGSGTWTINQVQDLRGFLPNNTAGSGAAGSGTGITTYLALLDTPNTYASSANKIQGVNAGETAIESKAATVTNLGTINIPIGQQYQINGGSVVVDAINDGVTTTASSQNAVFDALSLKEPILTKGNLTESVTGLQFNNTSQVIGSAADLSVSSGYVIPTTTNIDHAETAYMHSQNDADLSITNEGQLSTVGTTNNATIQSNTSGSNVLNVKGAGINVASASGNNITITGTEVDGSTTNEIQDLSLSGNTLTLSGDATTVDISQATAVLANTAKVTNATHTGDATGATALTLATVNSNIGTYNNVTINAKGLATAGSNVAYLTTEVDGSTSNELNTSMGWNNTTNEVSVVDAGGTKATTITGFLESEVDGSVTNEIQEPTRVGDLIGLTQTATTISIADKAPESGSGNYIQNQFSFAQTANQWINGAIRSGAHTLYDSNPLGGLYPYKTVTGSGTDVSIGLFSENELWFASGGNTAKVLRFDNNGAATFASTIQATTAKLTNLDDGYLPYHISDASGLGNSPIYTDGMGITIGAIATTVKLNVEGQIFSSPSAAPSYLFQGTNYYGQIQHLGGDLWGVGFGASATANGTTALAWNSLGNVGVGYTTGTEITNNKLAVNGSIYSSSTVNSTGYLLNNNNLFSSLSSDYLPYWDGTKFSPTEIKYSLGQYTINSVQDYVEFFLTKSNAVSTLKSLGFSKRNDTYFGNALNGVVTLGTNVDGSGNTSGYITPIMYNPNGDVIINSSTNATGGVTYIKSLTSTNTRLLSASSTGQLAAVTDGVGILKSNGSGTISYINDDVQPLSGTSPTYNINSGVDATLTITANTSVYMQNLVEGSTGTLKITNPTAVYKIKFYGYALDIAANLTYDANGITLKGLGYDQSFGWKYIGGKLLIHGTYYNQITY